MTRSANKENTYFHLAAWCANHHETTGIKIHPSSVPYDLVLEDVLSYISLLMLDHKKMAADHDLLVAQFAQLQQDFLDCKTQLLGSKKLIEEIKPIKSSKVKK